jgi:CHAT domain-containing protein
VPGLYLVDQLRQVLNGVPPDVRLDSQELLIAAAARQAQGATTVSFLLSADKLLAWIIKANATEFVQRHIDGLELRRLINVLSVQLDRTPEREDLWRPTLSRLHTLLLAHLPHVAESTALTIVADGVLSRVPFGSLYDSRTGNFVFERASVRMSPNLAFALRQDVNASIASSPQTAAAIGDPELRGPASQPFRRLPHARSEAIAIAKLYKNSSVVTGHDATKSRVLEAMTSADVLHYAGHAIGRISLGGSRLLLAGDAGDPQAALSAEDLRGRVKRPLRVVLAACETGSASTDRSAGLASLSGAFLRTGALSVVGTLWRVDDAASQPFFLNVHRSLVAGQPMAAAVARAQRACRSDAECRRGATTWIGATVYGSE